MEQSEGGGRWKLWAILGGVGTLIVLALIVWGLYSLGGEDQSALERFRDIAIIFIVLLFALTVVLLAAITAALGYLIFQIKDRVIPLLEEINGTVKRFHGTANFVTEEAVKPIITVAGTYARMRATMKTVAGRNGKRK
ncbi:MAG TPA: hypothetical protein VH482_11695 [Thermomicrobiales bacterium]|jgi:hypothetical protein